MKLGLELLARKRTKLVLGTFFETWIAVAEGTLKRSLGRDEYHLALTVAAGHRLAATGRTSVRQLDAAASGLGPNQAPPCRPVSTLIGPGEPLFLCLRTNAFLDLPALRAGVELAVLAGAEPPLPLALEHPLVTAEAVAPGRFLIELGPAAAGRP